MIFFVVCPFKIAVLNHTVLNVFVIQIFSHLWFEGKIILGVGVCVIVNDRVNTQCMLKAFIGYLVS